MTVLVFCLAAFALQNPCWGQGAAGTSGALAGDHHMAQGPRVQDQLVDLNVGMAMRHQKLEEELQQAQECADMQPRSDDEPTDKCTSKDYEALKRQFFENHEELEKRSDALRRKFKERDKEEMERLQKEDPLYTPDKGESWGSSGGDGPLGYPSTPISGNAVRATTEWIIGN